MEAVIILLRALFGTGVALGLAQYFEQEEWK